MSPSCHTQARSRTRHSSIALSTTLCSMPCQTPKRRCFSWSSAPGHRARDTVRFLEQTTPAFISPDLWPPNSPDLNPVDYKMWGIVQQRVYQSGVHDVDQLKQRLLDVWHGMEQSVVDSAIDKWRVRLRACVRARGDILNKLCDYVSNWLNGQRFQLCQT